MTDKEKIPRIILDAYDLLLQYRIVDITQPIGPNNDHIGTGWTFQCSSSVPYPNPENLPATVPLRIVIPEMFPYEPVSIYSICEEVLGFPHQDAETGKLCLKEERLAPRNAEKLVTYVRWAIEWLSDAATGNLLKPGDPYELPDFSRRNLSLPIEQRIFFHETEGSFLHWQSRIGEFGRVECIRSKIASGIFATQFFDKDQGMIQRVPFSSEILNNGDKIKGVWILLEDIRFKRHRPAQTYQELHELCLAHNLNFYKVLNVAWELDNRSQEIGIILVGFPISEFYGEENKEIHWQPILFPNLKTARKLSQSSKSKKPGKLWKRLKTKGYFRMSEPIPWGKATNITHERLYARGAYAPSLLSAHIAIFGCGALGSLVAELLARGGVQKLTLFDADTVQIGNLCRHPLDGRHLGTNKAQSLAKRLSSANPLSTIIGYPLNIPLNSNSLQNMQEIFSHIDVLVDCTTNDTAFEWLNQYVKTKRKRMVSLFFDFYAKLLTLCISGGKTSCSDIFQDLFSCVYNGQVPISPQEYFYQPAKAEQIIEGAGCWHPTFPALNAHIQMLAATAVDMINEHLRQKDAKGMVALIRRNSFTGIKSESHTLVEIIWTQDYQ